MPLSFAMRLALLGLGVVSIASHAQTLDATLANGLRVIVREDARSPIVETQVWYRIGARDEMPGKTGLSHALEHMMFQGTHAVPAGEFSRRISALGGQNNAYTTRNMTVYHETVAAQHLPEILKLEADRMHDLNFSDATFANEMKVVAEERRMRSEDQPGGVLWEGLYANAFQKSPNRSPVIGWMKDIQAYQPEDARRWYRQWYAPNNAVLVVVGDINAQDALKQIRRIFGALPAKKLASRQNLSEAPLQDDVRAQVSAPSDQPMLALAWKTPPLRHLNDQTPYALNMLAQVLDGNEASRLSRRLVREAPIASSVDAGYEMLSRTDEVLFTLMAMPAQNVTIDALQSALIKELQDIAEHGVSEAEVARARTQLRASDEFKKDSLSALAAQAGELETFGFDYRDEAAMKAHLSDVQPKAVQDAARMLLAQKHLVIELKPLPVKAGTQSALGTGVTVH